MQNKEADRGEGETRFPEDALADPKVQIVIRLLEIAGALAERISWPGLLLLVTLLIMWTFSSPEQKHEIVDLYILGKSGWTFHRGIIVSAVAALVFIAQNRVCKRRITKLERRNAELQTRNDELERRVLDLVKQSASKEETGG